MANAKKKTRLSLLATLLSVCLCLASSAATAQTALETPSLSDVSFISPYYFGPNAFPVPDMVCKVSGDLRVEVAGDYFDGRRGDRVFDISVKANIPLFSRRVNLSLWIPAIEWYRNTDRNMDVCRVAGKNRKEARRGSMTGDAYVSVDFQAFEEHDWVPDVVVRAAIKSASGGGYSLARYYDCPGYFFDVAAAKSFVASRLHDLRLRLAVTTGFLCWQTGNGRQNDAVQFGAMLGLYARRWSVSQSFGGYAGWESISCDNPQLAHDRPMVLTTEATYRIKRFELLASYRHGLSDYPYDRFRIGLAYHIGIVRRR
ncbi:MAG: hypothetical protein K2J51_03090 [Alistipes sp.]|nr:hypothetical protein [Alistipes sp.]